MPDEWTPDDTERWLNDFSLPPDILWNGLEVRPTHHVLKGGYGKWLRETPYHRGFFAAVHAVLAKIPAGEPMPTPREVAARAVEWAQTSHGQAELTEQPEDETPFG